MIWSFRTDGNCSVLELSCPKCMKLMLLNLVLLKHGRPRGCSHCSHCASQHCCTLHGPHHTASPIYHHLSAGTDEDEKHCSYQLISSTATPYLVGRDNPQPNLSCPGGSTSCYRAPGVAGEGHRQMYDLRCAHALHSDPTRQLPKAQKHQCFLPISPALSFCIHANLGSKIQRAPLTRLSCWPQQNEFVRVPLMAVEHLAVRTNTHLVTEPYTRALLPTVSTCLAKEYFCTSARKKLLSKDEYNKLTQN